jgi:hypothetical protein
MLEILQNLYGTSHFIGIVRVQSFVPKESIGKFPIGFKSYKNPLFFLYSQGGLIILF